MAAFMSALRKRSKVKSEKCQSSRLLLGYVHNGLIARVSEILRNRILLAH